MNRIQKVSSYLLIAFNMLLVAIPLDIIFQWFFRDTTLVRSIFYFGGLRESIQTPEGLVKASAIQSSLAKMIGLSADAIEILPLFLSLFVLKSIFRNYQKGEIFTTANATYYRYLGWLFFLDALFAKPIGESLMVLAATLSNPPGHRYITLSFGTPNMGVLFAGIIVVMISWVMLEASKLHDEQKFTV